MEGRDIDIEALKGIIICRSSGEYLVDLILDPKINPALLSSFAGALSMFGKENLGKIEEIKIKGLDVDMIIVNRYDLILMAIMEKDFAEQDLRNEAVKSLDIFYSTYKDKIDECDTSCVDVQEFEDFKKLLLVQILDYFDSIKDKEQVKDFGFFTDAIKKMKDSADNTDDLATFKSS